ncbi:cation efflux protein [Rozella allomycis CSF55]|uniref:Cation efflux protein n=1 Tax=Rozella allomycis (strain CSF55) TaxID=988480 RepID=A0A075B0X9_ROZAC|nr:Cation efflux protein transmembrane domain-containing protein [Rozella allomycis CSF55]RKP21878.1 cation efflux protein [Rozella allomycis CSF55]|eukprot:EPZ36166.1 Cation efflux protein transmembrane domain-containing protein [Rozella allomycis CSF55]
MPHSSECTNLLETNHMDLREHKSIVRNKLLCVTVLCITFMIIEIIFGLLSNSLAILSDAAHLLSDVASFLISIFATYLSEKAPSRKHSYGFHRAEILGALLSISLIWSLTIYLIFEAAERIRNPSDINGKTMTIVASIGLVVNLIMAKTLHSGSHHNVDSNMNIRAAFLHIIGDIIQSLGVLIAALIIWIYPEWRIADPLCTFLFSILVMFSTISLLKNAINVLMEATPSHIDPRSVINDFLNIQGVLQVYDLHIWSLTSGTYALSAHVLVESNRLPCRVHSKIANPALVLSCTCANNENEYIVPDEYSWILSQCSLVANEKYNINHSTIQIELGETCRAHCLQNLEFENSR